MLRLAARRSPLPWIVAAVAVATAAVPPAAAAPAAFRAAAGTAAVEPVSEGERAIFVPVSPTRLLDTRVQAPIVAAKGERSVQVAGVAGVPADALAAVVNVTAVTPTASGYLTVYPTGQSPRPTASNLNFLAKQVVANLATVRLGDGGKITIYNALNATTGGTHVVMDLAGYYRGHAHDDRYLPKAQAQARTAANAFACTGGTVLQSVAADGAPVCVTDSDTTYTAGPGLALNGTTFSAEQGRSAPSAFTCTGATLLQAVAANGAPTCVADSDTKYTAGSGLALNGTTFSAEQGRSAANAFFCASGTYLRSVSATGAPTCAVDKGVEFTTGLGLLLSNGVLSAEQGRSATNAFTCPVGWYLRVVAANGAPTCAADVDTDTDTQYAAGFGLYLDGNVFHAEQGRSAKNAMSCEEGHYLREIDANGAPTCAQDVDTDTDTDTNTTYQAGFGLSLSGTVFSAQQGRTAPNAFTCSAGQALRVVANDGTPTCAGVPAYTAGPGLALAGAQFSSAYGSTVVPVAGDQAAAANGSNLRAAMTSIVDASVTKPYVIALAPGHYALGTSPLLMKPNVSLVGAGRGVTVITGAHMSQSAGLVTLSPNALLANLSVRNVTDGTSWNIAVMANSGGPGELNARLYGVEALADQTMGESYGVLAFNGAHLTIEDSTITARNGTGNGIGIYSVSSATVLARGSEVVEAAPGSGGHALLTHNTSAIHFANGVVAGSAHKTSSTSDIKIMHSRLDAVTSGGVTCFGTYTPALAAATCA